MKKLLTIILSLIISSSFAQWNILSPYPTSNNLFDVVFVNENTGWICGWGGTILFTDDGGEHWIHQECPVDNELIKMSFINEEEGWVIGGSGTILSTSDGGQNWSRIFSSDTIRWGGVEFKNSNSGWAVGSTSSGFGIIMRTDDSGNSWETQFLVLDPKERFGDLYFADTSFGWVVGDGGIYHTNDGGGHWTKQYTCNSPHTELHITFIDSLNGWASERRVSGQGADVLLHTNDGGESWTQDTIQYAIEMMTTDLCFVDETHGWLLCYTVVVPGYSFLLYTIDGGSTWNTYPNSTSHNSDINSMCFIDPENGWIVGQAGCITHTNNGLDWNLQSLWTNTLGISDICFIDDQKGWAVGYSKVLAFYSYILQTNNGGEDWTINNDLQSYAAFNKICKVNENNLWVTAGAEVHHTIDGLNWEINHYFEYDHTNDIFFTDVKHGWVVGYDIFHKKSQIFHTNDEGMSWSEKYSGVGEYLTSIYFIDQNSGWVAGKSGDTGIIIKTNDGGITWSNQLFVDSVLFIKMQFQDINNGLIVGSNGSVYKTNNSGENWVEINEGFEVDFSEVFVVDSMNIWSVGSIGHHPEPVFEGLIYYSNNGGQTWTKQESGISNELSGIWFNDKNNGWIVGDYGIILNTDNGGVSGEEEYPMDYRSTINVLCYPNPFTTSTTLSYELQQPEKVSLRVYNHLGLLIYEIEENHPQGKQQLIWNAEGYSGGIYYYRLEVGSDVTNGKIVKVR